MKEITREGIIATDTQQQILIEGILKGNKKVSLFVFIGITLLVCTSIIWLSLGVYGGTMLWTWQERHDYTSSLESKNKALEIEVLDLRLLGKIANVFSPEELQKLKCRAEAIKQERQIKEDGDG